MEGTAAVATHSPVLDGLPQDGEPVKVRLVVPGAPHHHGTHTTTGRTHTHTHTHPITRPPTRATPVSSRGRRPHARTNAEPLHTTRRSPRRPPRARDTLPRRCRGGAKTVLLPPGRWTGGEDSRWRVVRTRPLFVRAARPRRRALSLLPPPLLPPPSSLLPPRGGRAGDESGTSRGRVGAGGARRRLGVTLVTHGLLLPAPASSRALESPREESSLGSWRGA